MQTADAIDWSAVDTVLLDMDGTLLDLRFDNWFWQEHVPSRYAALHGIAHADALALLQPKFRATVGTLEWYCVDHWTQELGLDIVGLKRALRARVGYLPGAQDFLLRLQARGKRRVLVTNAHPKTLAFKDEQLALLPYFDAWHSTHAFAAPKETAVFWPRLLAAEPFSPQRTLLVDDSLAVLDAARVFGIGWLRAVRCPDSGRPAQDTGRYAAVDRVADLL